MQSLSFVGAVVAISLLVVIIVAALSPQRL